VETPVFIITCFRPIHIYEAGPSHQQIAYHIWKNIRDLWISVASASSLQLQHFACMSHEIRTPLNCILGISSLLDEKELNSSQEIESVRLIVSSAGVLLRQIVDDVLDYSKLESGALDVDVKRTNLQGGGV
jgi:signal transduction histidine kinase